MLRSIATLAVAVLLGVVAARLLAARGVGLSWRSGPAMTGGAGAAPFPSGPSAEEVAQRGLAACSSPLSSAEVRIKSCTVAIESGSLSEVNRAIALCDRGTGRDMKHEAALAAADFDEAVRVGPGLATGYVCRRHAELTRGDVDGAIAD